MCAQTSQNNFVNEYFETQQKIYNTWFKNFMPNIEEPAPKKDNTFHSFFNNSFNPYCNAMDTYQNLYRFWTDLVSHSQGKAFDSGNFFDQWKETYINILSKGFVPNFTESIQSLMKEPLEIYQMYFSAAHNFFKPWINDSNQFQHLFEKSLHGDTDSFLEYMKLFRKVYEKTYGKLFEMPVLGMGREYYENEIQSAESFINYLNTLNEFFVTISKVGSETMESLIKNYQHMLENETQPKTFKEFYEFWWKQNEDAYFNLFKTDDFAQLLSQVADASVIFKKNYDKFLEQQLSFLPFPKNSDMTSVYKTVYDLKKQVKVLNKRVNDLIDQINSKQTDFKEGLV